MTKKPQTVSLEEARAARRPVGPVQSDAEDAETLKQAEIAQAMARAAAHPLQQQCAQMGKELNMMGMQSAFGNAVNTQFTDFAPIVWAESLAQIMMDKGMITVEEWQDMVFTRLHDRMEQAKQAVQLQRSGLVVPPTEVPPDLYTGPANHKKARND